MYGVAWRDPATDDFEFVINFGTDFVGDPREADVPFPVGDLVGVLTDERFGLNTIRELADADLPGWTDSPYPEFDMDDFDPDEFEDEGSRMSGIEDTENPLAGDVTAMVEKHLGVTPRKVDGFVMGGRFTGVDIRMPGGSPQSLFLELWSAGKRGGVVPCKADRYFACVTWEVAAGTVAMSWPKGASDDLGPLQVTLEEADESQTVSMMFSDGTRIDRDPRELDLPVSVDQLVALLSDPGIALP